MTLFAKNKKTENTEEPKNLESTGDFDETDFYKNKVDELRKRLYYDALGCKSKAAFDEDIVRYNDTGDFKLIMMTVNLERVNKGLGRKKGDEALKRISDIFFKFFPDFYHIGGEKFNILIPLDYDVTERMKKAVTELTVYLIGNKLNIDIYYGQCDTTDPLYNPSDISAMMMVAIERMYEDRRSKRPDNENIIKEEIEVKRLQKVLESKESVQKELEEKEREIEKKEAKKDMVNMTNELSSFFDEMKEIQNEMKNSEDILKKIREEEELADSEYIPGFPFEHDELMETVEKKNFKTMWFYQTELEITDNKNVLHKIRIMVYPLAYEKPPLTLTSLVIIEDEVNRHVYSGKNVKAGIAGTEFYINARFVIENNKAALSVAVSKRKDEFVIVENSRKERCHPGICTPYHFGKVFFDREIFPIRKNINGLMDCIVRTGYSEFEESDGNLKNGDDRYQILMNGNVLEIVKLKTE